jgi:hypothetical protein
MKGIKGGKYILVIFTDLLFLANGACATNRCQNNGACISLPIGYKCKCPVGFEGKHCERGKLIYILYKC